MGSKVSKTIKNSVKSVFRSSRRPNSFWASRKVKNAGKFVHSLNNVNPSQLRIKIPNRLSSLTLRKDKRAAAAKVRAAVIRSITRKN